MRKTRGTGRRLGAVLLALAMFLVFIPLMSGSAADGNTAFDIARQAFFEDLAKGSDELGLETIWIPDEPGIIERPYAEVDPLSAGGGNAYDPADIHPDIYNGPFTVGNEREFSVMVSQSNDALVTGKLIGQGSHSNIWVLNDADYHAKSSTTHSGSCQLNDMTPAKARNIANVLDGIYERMTDTATGFGEHAHKRILQNYSNCPWIGDIDNDGMVNFVFYDLAKFGYAGFFSNGDYFTTAGHSNLDMLHVSISGILGSNPMYYYGTLAHEFQHMLFHMYFDSNYTGSEDTSWYNESLADLAKIYYVQPGAETLISGRASEAAKNPYSTGSYSDFVNYNSLKSYGTGYLLSLMMFKKVPGHYTSGLYTYFRNTYPPAATVTEFNTNRSKTSGKTLAQLFGDAFYAIGLGGAGGASSFANTYWMFMENFAADGGTVRALNPASDAATTRFFNGNDSSESLWAQRDDFTGYPLASGGSIQLGGWGTGSPKSNATHEKIYRLTQGVSPNTVLNITVSDSGAGSATNYYVALRRPGTGADLPNADIYPLTPGTQRTINTNGKTAFLYAATLYREVNSATVSYSWSQPPAGTLDGVLTLNNYKPAAGQAVTATVSLAGTYNYAWTVGGAAAGTNSASYTTTAADIGKIVKVTVTSSTLSGSLEISTVPVAKAAGPSAPAAPQLLSKTSASVTLVSDAAYEYSIDNVLWQSSNIFANLLPETEYSFYQRVKATATQLASSASAKLNVTTAADVALAIALSQTAAHTFAAVTYGGYTAPAALTVTVSNAGSQPTGTLTVGFASPTANFTLNKTSIGSIAVSGTNTFTVQPAANLPAGNYSATVNVSGAGLTACSFPVSFTVNKRSLSVTGATVTQKTYDRTTAAAVTALTFSGLYSTETLALNTDYTVSGAAYNSAAAGASKTVSGSAALSGTAKANNYTLSSGSFSGLSAPNILQKAVTASGVTASKAYDGTNAFTNAQINISGASLAGVLSPDAVSLSSTGVTGTLAAGANAGSSGNLTLSGSFSLTGTAAANYSLTPQPTVAATITQATGSFDNPGPLSTVYAPGKTLASVVLPTGYAWNTPTMALSIPGGSYPATRDQGANYTQTTGSITVNVAAAEGTFPALSPITVTYTPGLTLAGVTLPAGCTWNTPATALSVPGGSYQATYKAANYTDAIGSVTVNVTAAAGTFPPVTAINVTYTPGLTLAGVNLPAGYTWNTPSTALNVPGGSYQATYRAANYTDAAGSVTVTVTAAAGDFGSPGPLSALYTPGLTLASVALPTGYTWNTPATALSIPGGSYPATRSQGANYTQTTGNITVNVAAAAGTFPMLSPITVAYTPGMTLAGVTLPAGYTWNTPATALSVPGGSYQATYRAANYTDAIGSVTVNVTAATGTFPTVSAINVVYTPGLTLAGVTLPAGCTWNAPTTALSVPGGSYQATYRAANYADATGNVTVNVLAATGSFPAVSAITVTYTPGLTLANVALPAGYIWNAPATALGVPGGSYPATYKATNYTDAAGSVAVNVTLSSLELSVSDWNPGAAASSTMITVTSNVAWTVSNSVSWLTVSPAGGTNNGSFTVYAATNAGMAPRGGTITVSGGGVSQTVTVAQDGAAASLTLSPSAWNPGPEASSAAISIRANVAWIVSSPAWLTTSLSGGMNDWSLTIYAEANTGTASRSGTVTVTGGGISRTVTVTQAGKPTARFDEHEVYIPYRKVSAIYFTGDAYYAVSGDTSIVTAHLSAGYGRPAAVLESQRRPWKFTKGESTTVFLLDENQQEIDRCRVHVTTSFWEWLIVILLFGWIWY